MAPMCQNTPTAALEVILDLMPLDITIKMEGLKAFIRHRNKSNSDHIVVTNGHLDLWNRHITSKGIPVSKEDIIPMQFNWNKPFSSEDLNYNTIYTASVVSVVS